MSLPICILKAQFCFHPPHPPSDFLSASLLSALSLSFVSVCLFVSRSLSVSLIVSRSLSHAVCLSLALCLTLSVSHYLSLYLSYSVSVSLSVSLSVCLCLSVCLSVSRCIVNNERRDTIDNPKYLQCFLFQPCTKSARRPRHGSVATLSAARTNSPGTSSRPPTLGCTRIICTVITNCKGSLGRGYE